MFGKRREHLFQHAVRLHRPQRHADFSVDVQNLMRMPLLSAADKAFLHGRRPLLIDRQAATIDAALLELLSQLAPVEVVTNDAGERDVGLQPAEHIGHVGRTAEPRFAPLFAQQDDRRFPGSPVRRRPRCNGRESGRPARARAGDRVFATN